MKKLLLLTFITTVTSLAIQAQGIRLNGYVNYTFDDRFEAYNSATSYFNGTIKGGMQWGAGLEYMASPELGIAATYYRQDTKAPVTYWDNINNQVANRELDIAINYIMGGTTGYVSPNPKIEGYGGIMLGAVIYNNKMPIAGDPTSSTKFAWGVKLGANIWATEKVGIKLQGHLLSGVQSAGGGFYFGTGGSGTGITTYSTLYQFSLGGGLVFRLTGE